MTPRTPHDILDDWRAAERELDEATDAELREAIEARIATLAAEHREAIVDRIEPVVDPSMMVADRLRNLAEP